MAVNEAQHRQWNAESQVRTWPKRERITVEVTPLLLKAAALQPGENVLEIGSGGGLAAIEASRAVAPAGSVTGFDLSAPLVGLATQRAAEAKRNNLTFIAGDAQVDAIPGAPFDVMMSQFGVMFFADPVAAFTNLRKHVRQGGRVAFACWQPAAKNTWYPGTVFAPFVPPPPPTPHGGPPPGPFAFGDPAYVEGILTKAGFGAVGVQPLSLAVDLDEDSIFDRETVEALPVDAAKKDEAWEALLKFKQSLLGDDGKLHITIAPQIVTASA
jgi:SAM-dependent methyltransferase